MFDNGAECVAGRGGVERVGVERVGVERGDENAKDCNEGPEGRRVRICMWEKGYEDREECGGLGSEESRSDEWDDNGSEVERCWEDVAVVEGRLVAGESALKGCNECCKLK